MVKRLTVPNMPATTTLACSPFDDDPGQISVAKKKSDLDILRGRYANAFTVWALENELILDLFSYTKSKDSPEQSILVGRFFIAPQRVQALINVLKRQMAIQKGMGATASLDRKKIRAKRK